MKRDWSMGALLRELSDRFLALIGTSVLTLVFFLVLPLIQAITAQPDADVMVRSVDTGALPPPPPPPEEPPPEEEEEEPEPPPDLMEEAPPLDLSQLEIALEPGVGGGLMAGDFAMDLGTVMAASENVDALFSMADLDQRPRVIYQPGPQLTAGLRKRGGGTVYVLFIVDQGGRVQNPIVQSTPDPAYERPATDTVKKWRFEPGKRNGEPVRFRMRVPITFPKG